MIEGGVFSTVIFHMYMFPKNFDFSTNEALQLGVGKDLDFCPQVWIFIDLRPLVMVDFLLLLASSKFAMLGSNRWLPRRYFLLPLTRHQSIILTHWDPICLWHWNGDRSVQGISTTLRCWAENYGCSTHVSALYLLLCLTRHQSTIEIAPKTWHNPVRRLLNDQMLASKRCLVGKRWSCLSWSSFNHQLFSITSLVLNKREKCIFQPPTLICIWLPSYMHFQFRRTSQRITMVQPGCDVNTATTKEHPIKQWMIISCFVGP